MAHDLKTPLTGVIGFTDVLKQDNDILSASDRLEMLSMIGRDAQKMSNIIDELLLLSSVRQEVVETEPLDMAAIVAEVLGRIGYLLREHDVDLVVSTPWPSAVGYGPWVEEVWVNYISNAIKYGGDSPRVELGAVQEEDGMVRFFVRDNGKGLTAAQQAQLFIAV